MSELQQFGGDWTIEKLDILTSYLDAYLTAPNFRERQWSTMAEDDYRP